jgi:hypothetical protein
MEYNYTIINRYNTLINRVQKNNNMDDSTVGDLKWSIRSDDFRGWLLCDGRLVLKSTYDKLFDLIGHSFGNANVGTYGSTHFRLPDARNRVVGAVGPSRNETVNGSVINLSQRLLGNLTEYIYIYRKLF